MNVCRTHHHPLKFYTPRKLFYTKELPAPVAPVLIEKKTIKAHHALSRLAENKELFKELSTIHFLFFFKWAPTPPIHINSAAHTSCAIIQRNPLDQKFYKKIENFKIFENELKSEEESVFSISIPIIAYEDGIEYDGVNLTIIKSMDLRPNFIVVRSLEHYLKTEKKFYDLDSFTKEILNPLKDLLNNSGYWDFEECDAHYQLTGSVLLFQLIGRPIPKGFGPLSSFGCTTDSVQENEQSVRLGKVIDCTYHWPTKE